MAEENSSESIESLKNKIKELEEKNNTLQELQNTHGDLFKMIIHDLKGPVGEITANLDLLKNDKSLSEYNQEFVETSILGCDDLYRMILNILEISKIEEGQMVLNKKPFRIEEVIDEKTRKIKTLANQNKISLEMEIKGKLKPMNADKDIIERVLANLLMNAISYSPFEGKITVTAEPAENEKFVKVSVSDQGRGIPEDSQKNIFDKFSQEVKNGDRTKYSTGLGLTFCKLAVEAHNGTIWVESKVGEGSTFSFKIPV